MVLHLLSGILRDSNLSSEKLEISVLRYYFAFNARRDTIDMKKKHHAHNLFHNN